MEYTDAISTRLEPTTTTPDEVIDQFRAVSEGIYDDMQLDPQEPDWNRRVGRVVVVLSASRSGSSLIFQALSNSGDVIAPAGEHEPWMFLSGNKYPFTDSDYMTEMADESRLLHLLRNDLLVREDEVSGPEYAEILWNRLAVRQAQNLDGSRRFIEGIANSESVDRVMHQYVTDTLKSQGAQRPLRTVLGDSDDMSALPIENPPYIDQPLARRATLDEIGNRTLLFKSPSDAYRPGMYEKLFPDAEISYVHLTRGFVQTTNGLMDGWSKDAIGFASNAVGLAGATLDIQGYSQCEATRAYWCFDLFPGWDKLKGAPLVEVCARQWVDAHRAIAESFASKGRVAFESFYTHRGTFYEDIEAATGIDLRGYDWSEEVMSTEPPSQFRWLKREGLFRQIGSHLTAQTMEEVVDLQEKLGYSMEASTWH